MIPRDCRRLAEVDFPIAEVSRHSAREKSIRHGHPSTLHLWWARRPLAACRAMLLALLLPDPAHEHCPDEFKTGARLALKPPLSGPRGQRDQDLRDALLKFIADFANWDAAADPVYVEAARALVRAAHGDEPPLVVDPFAGGGSIPLEALRLGCDAFASDLNPVACLILKVLLEDIPRHGASLADELRRAGAEVKAAAEKELGEFYPPDPDGARPIAYLWARTVRCEASGCGAQIPLARSFWLAKKEVWGRKGGKRVKLRGKQALRYSVERPRRHLPEIAFEIFEPKADSSVPRGTVSRAKAACPACNVVLPPERVRAQLSAQRGGADVIFDGKGTRVGGARLLAVVTLDDEERGRRYRLPADADYRAVWKATKALGRRLGERLPGGLSPVPDEPLPPVGTLGFRVQRYGMLQWGDLFTARQKLALVSQASLIRAACPDPHLASGTRERILAPAISKLADTNSVVCTWQIDPARLRATFARQALPMTWDFAEASCLGDGAGNLKFCVEAIAEVLERGSAGRPATVDQATAHRSSLPDVGAGVWFTDPPYYDAVPYADLSDFFLVWLKRVMIGGAFPLHDPFDRRNDLSPKAHEIVQDDTKLHEGRPKDRRFFELAMQTVFSEGRRILDEYGVGCVVFAHKTTEGWEALLSAMIAGRWVITGSWPIASELASRQRARESAALATSIHLVCRPRSDDAGVGDWGDVVRALPGRIEEWMDRLSGEGIRGADLVFACIGPALELFSKYRAVETPEGEVVGLAANPEARTEPAKRGYLSYVWEVVGRTALARVLSAGEAGARNGGAGALEEDARLTALFLWTVQSTKLAEDGDEDDEEESDDDAEAEESGVRGGGKKGLTLIYDVARRFAQPLGIHLDQWEGRIIETDKGVVRLLPVRERAVQLFGEGGASAVARRIEGAAKRSAAVQADLFPELAAPAGGPRERPGRGGRRSAASAEDLEARRDATTLDRVHAAMLLQAGGATNALRTLLQAETQRGPDFLRLANALSALYPQDSDEKRLLDAMLLAVPR